MGGPHPRPVHLPSVRIHYVSLWGVFEKSARLKVEAPAERRLVPVHAKAAQKEVCFPHAQAKACGYGRHLFRY